VILGGLFILVVLFLPGGLVSIPARLKATWKKIRGEPEPPPASSTQPAQPVSAKP
jgi:urea transport system permease protein